MAKTNSANRCSTRLPLSGKQLIQTRVLEIRNQELEGVIATASKPSNFQSPTSNLQHPSSNFKDRPIEDLLRALTSPDLAEIVALTLRVTGIALIISTIIGAPLGAIIGLSKFRGKSFV